MAGPCRDLGDFLAVLEKAGELRRISVAVDPHLEITEIATRVVKAGGPALLFERAEGFPCPVAINLFGSARRIELGLGRSPADIGAQWARAAQDLSAPTLSHVWKHRRLLLSALRMAPRRRWDGPVFQVSEPPNLDMFPVLTCWPNDGGRFFTLPLVITQNPAGRRNVGMYRLQVYDPRTTGMHIQIERGGGAHYAEWEALQKPMPVAVALGCDPATILSSVMPLPENMDELAFAGLLRGRPLTTVRLDNGVDAPAHADILLEGFVPPFERRTEGPFGDHLGHYSKAAPHPVFHVTRVHRRKNAVYPATVVGIPPQEDKYMGQAVQDILLPLLKIMRPELTDLWAYQEAGFHNLAVAGVKQRYAKEGIKTALGLMGQGQMSLTKCIILVDPHVNVRSFPDVLDAVRTHFDPAEDFILIPGTAQDTLDFTGFKMNLGSKMILDATGGPASHHRWDPFPPRLVGPGNVPLPCRSWRDSLLAVRIPEASPLTGKETVDWLVREGQAARFKWIAVVSGDVPLDDDERLLWGIFTRFDCARDVAAGGATLSGVRAALSGPLAIDATRKPGYPDPLVMSPDIIQRVDRRWTDYGL